MLLEAKLAMTVPWNGSMKQARNANGFTFPSSTVTFGLVAVLLTNGTLFAWATGEAANVLELVTAPSTATTLSWVISLVIALVDSEGSDLLSATTRVIFLPRTPPVALTSLSASFAPLTDDWPKVACPPVSSQLAPILMSVAAAGAGFLSPPHPATTDASMRTVNARAQ